MFSMIKDALADRGLSVSAEFFMSDFEQNIRNSFTQFFPDVKPKGCHFHYAKAVFSKVSKNGLKPVYSDVKNSKFAGFVRACIGLPYVPLERLNEGVRNLYILATRLKGRQRRFSVKMIKYIEKTWIRGAYPPATWNMFQHEGVKTNNHAEGYNFKLGNKKRISKHPNPYVLVDVFKQEFSESLDDAITAKSGNPNKKYKSKKLTNLINKRTELERNLKAGNTELIIYQQAMGGSVISLDARARNVDKEIEAFELDSEDE